jgi:hypothetical protein
VRFWKRRKNAFRGGGGGDDYFFFLFSLVFAQRSKLTPARDHKANNLARF